MSLCRLCRPAPILAILTLCLVGPREVVAEDARLAFFEQKIRPVLVEQCYACHSVKVSRGGLRLDHRAALLKGGDLGPAVVPGKPEQSLLLRALRYEDETLRMPPKKKLSSAILADFERWIRDGAIDPRDAAGSVAGGLTSEAVRKHWAFQTPTRPAVPAVVLTAWTRNPIDRFLLARQESKGLTPSPHADRRTLIRRLSYDLLGLPPSADEVDAFLADTRPDAYERLVERMLASPHYGERWGRHWLDVARFADTKDGVLQFGDDRVRPYAYTYRDYVIAAWNADLPFDRFVEEQLAADLLPQPGDPSRLAGLGYLTLGRQFDNNIHDVIDDRIDTVARGFLGLTVSCARCHDHKYDPVSMKDYYSLYGIFAASEAPLELPLLRPASGGASTEVENQISSKRKEIQEFLSRQHRLLLEQSRQRIPDYLVRVATTRPDPLETAIFFLSLAPEDLRPQTVNTWRRLIERRAQPLDPVFRPWYEVMRLPEDRIASSYPALRETWKKLPVGTGEGQINSLVLQALSHATVTSRESLARTYGELFRKLYDTSKKAPLSTPAEQQLLALVTATDSPAYIPPGRTRDFMSRSEKDAFGGKMQELDRLAVRSPHAAPRAMALVDIEHPTNPRIFLRGDPSRPGDEVPRQFLQVLSRGERKPFSHGSGRLDLARSIVDPNNPLTARVVINRVWMHHFREPLVDSPSDFGLRTVAPLHQDLLDWLAVEFIEGGWSLKRLHRLIVLSATYQQTSADRPDMARLDPDNRLLWRMHRRRLDLESMRDTLLSLSGRLDASLHGRPVDVAGNPLERRRTVYGLVDRQSLPGLFRAFDFASPDQSIERRPQTTVPQQALFGLNSPFVVEQARALADRMSAAKYPSANARIQALYREVLARQPSSHEQQLAREFVSQPRPADAASRLDSWQQLAQVLLLTNEVHFVD
ncbi:MAG: PSD1 and planctomycete cytochrome C domain-containing protein [Gemmataceae bacterium]